MSDVSHGSSTRTPPEPVFARNAPIRSNEKLSKSSTPRAYPALSHTRGCTWKELLTCVACPFAVDVSDGASATATQYRTPNETRLETHHGSPGGMAATRAPSNSKWRTPPLTLARPAM